MGRFTVFALTIFIASLIAVSAYSCQPAPDIYINNFEVTPSPITQGDIAVLRWNVSGATIIKINNGIGEVPPYGNLEIKPGQTTEYILIASNSSTSNQKAVTLIINNPPTVTTPEHIEVPVISALDTESLLSSRGKEVQVEGDVTYISRWLPDRFTGQGTTRPWMFIFFMKNIWEGAAENSGNMGHYCPECWRDYTGYFRAIIKPDYLPDFFAYLPSGYVVNEQLPIIRGGAAGWNSIAGSVSSSGGFIVQEPFHIILRGTMEGYLAAPAIYLTNVNQIVTVKH